MDSFLITVDGSEPEVSPGTVRRLLDTSARFWLDVADMDKTTTGALLRETFGFHPLAVQDAEHFGQRPKIDPYDDFTLMVIYGATSSGRISLHCRQRDSLRPRCRHHGHRGSTDHGRATRPASRLLQPYAAQRRYGGWRLQHMSVPVRCRYCGVQMVGSANGVWLALPYAALSGFCPASIDDERHVPELAFGPDDLVALIEGH